MTTENLPSDNQEDMLILVDSSDNEIGFLSKSECHMGAGQLHRAFSVFIFNSSGEVLIQKRSPQKEALLVTFDAAMLSYHYIHLFRFKAVFVRFEWLSFLIRHTKSPMMKQVS